MSHTDDVSRPDPHALSGSAQDLHHQIQRLESQIQRLEGHLQAAETASRQARRLFTHHPHVSFLLTPTGRIVEANLQAGLILGSPVKGLEHRRLSQFLAPASQAALATLLKRVFDTPGCVREELVLLAADGAPLAIMVAVHQTHEAGEPPGCQLVVTDITSLKQAHLTLMDEIEALQYTVRVHEGHTRRLDEEVQDVVRATQIQLHLHLGRVQNYLKLHQKEVHVDGRVYTHLSTTQDVLATAFVLVESLSQYLQARPLRLKRTGVDLNRVMTEVRKELHGSLAGREIQWTCDELPTVLGDSKALEIMLFEYLTNALKFSQTRETTRIHVHVQDTGREYLIGIEDNGVGFNLRHKDKAFELFGRLHPEGAYSGIGLGLAVVRQLAERSGGRAWGEGKVDQGATFWLACPKVPRTQA